MELIYQGRHDAVDVPLPDGREPTIANGESFDFPAAIAKQLLAQGDEWAPKKAPKTPADDAGKE